jgi:hypothetical protein
LVEEIYDVEFDESNSSQGAHENLDDVDDESLREAMKNIPVRDIKPKDDATGRISKWAVVTDFPLDDILCNHDATGRISKCVVDLGALNIEFTPRKAMKF